MIVILLPAYNEAESLPRLLPRLRETLDTTGEPWRIVVCDDGSRDATPALLAQYAREMPIDVLTHRINRGLGETVRDLIEHATGICAPQDTVIRLDCDDTHDPGVITAMRERLAQGFDVVVASRFQPGGGQVGLDAYRHFVSLTANLFMKAFFPIRGVREYSCGYRAYRAAILQRAIEVYGNNFVQLKGLGFTCTLEKLIKLDLIGARIGEVPFVLRYDRKLSTSKMIGSVTTLGYMVMTLLYHWPWGGWRSQALRRRAGGG